MEEVQKEKKMLKPRFIRGSIYIADLGNDCKTGEQIGRRPVLVIQNDKANQIKPTIVVATITTNMPNKLTPVHVMLSAKKYERINNDCVIQLDQIKTISKSRVQIPLPLQKLDQEDMKLVDKGLLFSLGMSID